MKTELNSQKGREGEWAGGTGNLLHREGKCRLGFQVNKEKEGRRVVVVFPSFVRSIYKLVGRILENLCLFPGRGDVMSSINLSVILESH